MRAPITSKRRSVNKRSIVDAISNAFKIHFYLYSVRTNARTLANATPHPAHCFIDKAGVWRRCFEHDDKNSSLILPFLFSFSFFFIIPIAFGLFFLPFFGLSVHLFNVGGFKCNCNCNSDCNSTFQWQNYKITLWQYQCKGKNIRYSVGICVYVNVCVSFIHY